MVMANQLTLERLIVGFLIYLVIRGAQTNFGLELIRGFIIFIVVFLLLQLFLGGGLLQKKTTWLSTILVNLGLILLLIMVALIGLASLLQNLF